MGTVVPTRSIALSPNLSVDLPMRGCAKMFMAWLTAMRIAISLAVAPWTLTRAKRAKVMNICLLLPSSIVSR